MDDDDGEEGQQGKAEEAAQSPDASLEQADNVNVNTEDTAASGKVTSLHTPDEQYDDDEDLLSLAIGTMPTTPNGPTTPMVLRMDCCLLLMSYL